MTRDVTSAADTCQLGLICGEGPRHVTEKPNFLSQNIQYLSLVLEYLELTRGGLFQNIPSYDGNSNMSSGYSAKFTILVKFSLNVLTIVTGIE